MMAMAVGAAGRAPHRRVRLLQRLRQHAPLRQRPVLALELALVVRPAADDVLERLLPHLARLVRDRCRSPRARCAWSSGRCRSRRGRRRSGRARRPTRPSAPGGCTASAAAARRSRCASPWCARRSRRRAPRGSSSARTPRGSDARRSRRRGSPSARRSTACSSTLLVRLVLGVARSRAAARGSRRRARTASRTPLRRVGGGKLLQPA